MPLLSYKTNKQPKQKTSATRGFFKLNRDAIAISKNLSFLQKERFAYICSKIDQSRFDIWNKNYKYLILN